MDIKIAAIGAASEDVFIAGADISAHCNPKTGECVEQFPLGAKLNIDKVVFDTGGGATNAAVTFARQGMHAMFIGRIGHDPAGQAVIRALGEENIDTSHIVYDELRGTQYSTILLADSGERTILIYRGASEHHKTSEYDFEHVEAQWYYISSVGGELELVEKVIAHAKASGAKIAFNPGAAELAKPDQLKALLSGLTVLSLNKEEMAQLFSGNSAEELAIAANQSVPLVVVTDGPAGAVAVGGGKLVKAGMYEDVPVIDRTGAGDAFSSGFTAMVAKGEPLDKAILFASANSTSVVAKIGAKSGILHHHSHLHDMPMHVQKL